VCSSDLRDIHPLRAAFKRGARSYFFRKQLSSNSVKRWDYDISHHIYIDDSALMFQYKNKKYYLLTGGLPIETIGLFLKAMPENWSFKEMNLIHDWNSDDSGEKRLVILPRVKGYKRISDDEVRRILKGTNKTITEIKLFSFLGIAGITGYVYSQCALEAHATFRKRFGTFFYFLEKSFKLKPIVKLPEIKPEQFHFRLTDILIHPIRSLHGLISGLVELVRYIQKSKKEKAETDV
jgi:hypothetical protein